VKGWGKIPQANGSPNQVGVALLISDKSDFKPKLVKKDKEGHFMLIKGAIFWENIIIINIYSLNVCVPNYINQTLLDIKTQIDPNTKTVDDINSPLSPIKRSPRQSINKETLEYNDTLDNMDLTDICRIFYSTTQNTHSSQHHMELSSR
jgi:hypothetical protein